MFKLLPRHIPFFTEKVTLSCLSYASDRKWYAFYINTEGRGYCIFSLDFVFSVRDFWKHLLNTKITVSPTLLVTLTC